VFPTPGKRNDVLYVKVVNLYSLTTNTAKTHRSLEDGSGVYVLNELIQLASTPSFLVATMQEKPTVSVSFPVFLLRNQSSLPHQFKIVVPIRTNSRLDALLVLCVIRRMTRLLICELLLSDERVAFLIVLTLPCLLVKRH
jgi:hypothetical protein